MPLPDPTPGLVIGYAYLWRDEALDGLDEGRKDRPAVIVLAVQRDEGVIIVTVAPVTHTPPSDPGTAVEIPQTTKQRLGLDDERSWILAADLNQFVWPGVDLRPVRRDADRLDYGLLPAGLYRAVQDRVLALAKDRLLRVTPR